MDINGTIGIKIRKIWIIGIKILIMPDDFEWGMGIIRIPTGIITEPEQ